MEVGGLKASKSLICECVYQSIEAKMSVIFGFLKKITGGLHGSPDGLRGPTSGRETKRGFGAKHNEFDWTWQVMQALQLVGFIHLDK